MRRTATALLIGLAAVASVPAAAQFYGAPPPPPGPGYYPGYGYERGWDRPRYRRAYVSRVCATDRGVCYQRPQEIGTWCKCGGGATRATGAIVPER